MTLSVTENFQKSRNRLIYFSSIGSLLCFYPVTSDSSLFGLSFANLEPESITNIFFCISLFVFIEFLIRMFEEMPVLFGQHANAFERIEVSNFQNGELIDALRQISIKFNDVLSNQSEITTQKHSELVSTKVSIEQSIERATREFVPGKFTSRAGKLRVWVEYLSGLLVFTIYFLIFIFKALNA